MTLPRFFALVAFPLGVASADGRTLEFGEKAHLWKPPYAALLYNDGPVYPRQAEDQLAGRIDSVYRDVDEIRATGVLDLEKPAGILVARLLERSGGGVPVGADLGPIQDEDDLDGDGGQVFDQVGGKRIAGLDRLILRAVTVYGNAAGYVPQWDVARMWRV